MNQTYKKIVNLIASRIFGYLVLILGALQSIWVAISSRYPMAFDEAYHYNLIKLHSDTWSPIIYSQPPGPAPYGALARDPSQLYHWLLSFPYRILESLGASEFVTVVTLRMFSVAMFCWGLWLFRKLLIQTKASLAAVQAALLFFVLIPTVTLLAGQLNYDNLQFPLLALALLMTVSLSQRVRSGKLPFDKVFGLLIVCLLGTLNKFTFLPIITAITIYLVWLVVTQGNFSKMFRRSAQDWFKMPDLPRKALLMASGALVGLFIWFYGINTIVYQNPVVQCHQVIAESRCEFFEPWERNHNLSHQSIKVSPNPLKFTADWVGGMFYRLFFTINGATGPKRYVNMVAMPMAIAATVLAAVGSILTLRYAREILVKDNVFVILLFTSLIYLISLWGRNYNDFLNLGQMVAINGRYLQPILLPIIVLMIASYQHALSMKPKIKLAILAISLVMFSVGGGITGFIHYSDPDWYFQGQSFLVQMNNLARKLIAPLFLWRS